MTKTNVFIVIALLTLMALFGSGRAAAAKIGPVQPVYASACPANERLTLDGQGRIRVPARYVRLVYQYAVAEGIDPVLYFSLIWKESEFCRLVHSPADAYGPAQLTLAAAKDVGVDRTDIHGNFLGGARYFARLKRQFGSDELALAAYNAGPGRVRQYGGVPPIRETQNYVSRISEYRQHPGIPQLLGAAIR